MHTTHEWCNPWTPGYSTVIFSKSVSKIKWLDVANIETPDWVYTLRTVVSDSTGISKHNHKCYSYYCSIHNVLGIVVSRYSVSISSLFGVCTSVASCELFGLWLQVVCLRELGISCARVFRFVVNFGRFRFRTSNSS